MQLYSYFRSSAAYRVRIALNLKGLPYEYLAVHLLKDGGQQLSADYRKVNPTALVPTLVDGDAVIGQSLAIIEYLEETHPQAPLLPADAIGRARARPGAGHRLRYPSAEQPARAEVPQAHAGRGRGRQDGLVSTLGAPGLEALEAQLAGSAATGRFCHGDTPTIADLCLVPQVANARRFECDLSAMPTVVRIDAACRELPAFEAAAPGRQPDAE